jgi:hypothetical protein
MTVGMHWAMGIWPILYPTAQPPLFVFVNFNKITPFFPPTSFHQISQFYGRFDIWDLKPIRLLIVNPIISGFDGIIKTNTNFTFELQFFSLW